MKNSYVSLPKPSTLKTLVCAALREDVGSGDITTRLLIPRARRARAVIVAGQTGIVCGMSIARCVCAQVDRGLRFSPLVKDGQRIRRGQVIASMKGRAASILTSERVTLNFLGLLSGIASRTRVFVEAVRPYTTRILDTRKTIPGLRALEKYAVRVGGGHNHRSGLYDMVLIKENHIDAARPQRIPELLRAARKRIPKGMPLEVEVRSLDELQDAFLAKPDIILLDNMSVRDMRQAVRLRNSLNKRGLPFLEASGNIALATIKAYASTGVERISLGTLTKDVETFNFSLEWKVRYQ